MENIKVDNLRDRVYVLMALLPSDNVTTYGDIAAMAGHSYAARQVGEIAHGGVTCRGIGLLIQEAVWLLVFLEGSAHKG